MITELNQVITESELPIQDMISELEKLLTCVLMHVDVHVSTIGQSFNTKFACIYRVGF